MVRVTPIPNSPDKNTAGSLSPDLPHRKATVKTAKPKADPSAEILPLSTLAPDLSASMMEIPTTAITMDIQVAIRTFSLRQIHPRTAAINGVVAKRSIAFATEVV